MWGAWPPKPFVVVGKSDCEDVLCHGPFYDHILKIIYSKERRGGSFRSLAPRRTYVQTLHETKGGGVTFLLESGEGTVQRGSRGPRETLVGVKYLLNLKGRKDGQCGILSAALALKSVTG